MSFLEPSTIERYEDMPSATVSALGLASIALRQIPTGTRCVFTVSVPNSPPLAAWSIAKGASGAAQILMSWAGPTPVGPFTIDGPERLFVTGTGLSPTSPVQAIALGKRGPAALIDPEVPTGPAQFTVPTGGPPTLLGVIAPGTGTRTVSSLPTGLRSVTIHVNGSGVSGASLSVYGTGAGVAEYFVGELPLIPDGSGNTGNPPITFAVDPDETTLLITNTGPAVGFTVLGSFTDRAVYLQPPAGMPASASQLASTSAIAPGLDRSLWVAQADCPRKHAQLAVGNAGGTLVAAPGAGLRIKMFGCSANIVAAGDCNLTATLGGVPLSRWRTNAAALSLAYRDFKGLEVDANTAVTVGTAGTATCTYDLDYDIVPA